MPTALKRALRKLESCILSHYAVRHLPRDKEFEQSADDALASAVLSIIVPVHDAPAVTRRCLMSLQKYAPNAEIILVDDASKLDETKKLLNDFADRNGWKLIRHSEPLGHSRACSAGTALATRPYLCLLNSDTVVTPWCWRPIVQVFEANPQIGVTGPSTSSSGTAQTLALAHSIRHDLNDSQICEYARRLLDECGSPVITDLPCVTGFAFFIRRRIWDQFGGFDQNLPDYGNESELCRRIVEKGIRVVWVRNSYIHHFAGASYGKTIGSKSILTRKQNAFEYISGKHGNCEPS